MAHQPEPVSSLGSKEKRPDAANGNAKPSAGSSSQSTNRQAQGKLVFGSNVNRAPKETEKVPGVLSFGNRYHTYLALQKELTKTLLNMLQVAAKESNKQEQPPKKEEPKFQPFSGKKYSLRG